MSGHADEHTSTFDRVVLAAITANLAVVAWGLLDEEHAELADVIDEAILWFFAVELMLRVWMSHGIAYFKDFWNSLDAVVITVALLPVAGSGIALLRLVRLAKSVHLMRHTSHLRLFRWFVRWNNRERHWLEVKVVNGFLQPRCFYCEGPVKWRHTRVNRHMWVYGKCCGDRRKQWVDALHG